MVEGGRVLAAVNGGEYYEGVRKLPSGDLWRSFQEAGGFPISVSSWLPS